MENWKNQVKEEILEAVRSQVIDSMIAFHEHSISVLRYDVSLAQNQSTADTFVCRDVKAKKADRPEASSASKAPVRPPPGNPRWSLSVDDTPNVGAGPSEDKEKEAEGPEPANTNTNTTTKNGGNGGNPKANNGNRVTKATPRSTIKRGKGKETQRSLQDLWLATARESGRGPANPGHAYAQGSKKRSENQDS